MIELIIPSNREMMLVVRLTTAGILSKSRLNIDALDDAKMAVEEACLTLIRYAGRDKIRIAFSTDDNSVECSFYAEGEANRRGSIPDEKELDVVRTILSSMADETEIDIDDTGIHFIRMKKLLPT